jgi:glycosyltransferase involved in cell wall biosynthesis
MSAFSRLLTWERTDPDADVLVVTNMWPHPDKLRYGNFVQREVEAMAARGLRCDVLFIRGYLSPLAYPLAALKLFVDSLRGRRYALVHGYSGESALAVRFHLRVPVLVSYMGDDLLGTPLADGTFTAKSRLRRWLVRQHSRLTTATITMSREMEEVLPKPVQRRNSVILHGIDRDQFKPVPREEARRELGWDDDERVALFVAEPEVERKRHWLAEAAVEHAAREVPGIRLEVAARVPPEEIPRLMSAADCLILTSVHEGSPNVVKEALSCNLPVVATPAGDVRERLARPEPSWVCEPTPESLGAALAECMREPRRSNGREVSEEVGLEHTSAQVLSLYDELKR